MTKKELKERHYEIGHVLDILEVGERVHITSDGNEWYNARYWELVDGKSLYFFTSEGRLTVLNTPFILTQLPEEDEDTNQEDTV